MRRPPYRILLPLVLFLLAPIRYVGLYQGISDGLQPDESIVVNRALYFSTGDLNPHFFYYPSFSMYLTSLAIGTKIAFLFFTGTVHSIEEAKAFFIHNPSSVYKVARSAAAFVGLLCPMTLYFWGRKLIGEKTAFMVALLTLLTPSLVQQAHYAKPDALLTWLGLLAFLASCNAYRLKSFQWLVGSAALCGLAFSTKYNAVPFLIPVLLVFIRLSLEGHWSVDILIRRGVILMGIFLISFLAGTPYAVLDFSTFITHIRSIRSYTSNAGTSPIPPGAIFRNAWRIGSQAGGQLGLGLCYLGGLLIAFISRNIYSKIAAVCSAGFLIFIAAQSVAFSRYFDPALPILIFSTITAAINLFEQTTRFDVRVLCITYLFCLLSFSATGSWQTVSEFRRPYSLELARQWVLTHCADGSKILTDASAPSLPLTRNALNELIQKTTVSGNIKGALFRLNLDYYDEKQKHFDVYLSSQAIMTMPPDLLQRGRSIQRLEAIDRGLGPLIEKGFNYVITSSNEEGLYSPGGPGENLLQFRAFYNSLTRNPKIEQVFDTSSTDAIGPRVRIFHLNP